LLGGGLGMLTNSLGPGSDSIIEMKMVSAKGDLLTINSVENADLFWALRGAGGGSFGIVTSFKVRIHEMINPVIYFSYKWANAADPVSLISKYTLWLKTVPATLTAYLDVSNLVFDRSGSDHVIEIYGVFEGTLPDSTIILNALLNAIGIRPDRNEEISQSRPYIDVLLEFSQIPGKNFSVLAQPEKATEMHYYKGVGIFYPKPLSDETIKIMLKFMAMAPNSDSDISMQLISSENGKGFKDRSDSAFVHGNQLVVLQVQTQWPGVGKNAPECVECLSWSSKFVAALDTNHRSEYPTNYVSYYQNYIDKNTKEWERGYYGDSFERLTTVKAKIDSENVFQFPQSIPLTSTMKPGSNSYGVKSSSLFYTMVFISVLVYLSLS
jgi:hypothetical protein